MDTEAMRHIQRKGNKAMTDNTMDHNSIQDRDETEIDLVMLAKDFSRIFRKFWWLF